MHIFHVNHLVYASIIQKLFETFGGNSNRLSMQKIARKIYHTKSYSLLFFFLCVLIEVGDELLDGFLVDSLIKKQTDSWRAEKKITRTTTAATKYVNGFCCYSADRISGLSALAFSKWAFQTWIDCACVRERHNKIVSESMFYAQWNVRRDKMVQTKKKQPNWKEW